MATLVVPKGLTCTDATRVRGTHVSTPGHAPSILLEFRGELGKQTSPLFAAVRPSQIAHECLPIGLELLLYLADLIVDARPLAHYILYLLLFLSQ